MDFGPNKAGFKVGLWNSNDKFDEKLESGTFQKQIVKFTVFLSEPWQSETSIHKLQHPPAISIHAFTEKKNWEGRPSGGILIYYEKKKLDNHPHENLV